MLSESKAFTLAPKDVNTDVVREWPRDTAACSGDM